MKGRSTANFHILYVETYPAGSHGRALDLLIAHSRHTIEPLYVEREHWRWLAIAAHFQVAEMLGNRGSMRPPDALILSGPIDITALVAMLPAEYRDIPRVAYFHESQWTYPSEDADPRPYLLHHLNAVAACDECWFNSRYHLNTFWNAAVSPAGNARMRRLGQRLRHHLRHRCRVVYPPVDVESTIQPSDGSVVERRILWNARWERDKRPDRFVAMLDALTAQGINPPISVLGTVGRDVADIRRDLGSHSRRVTIAGHISSREDYESAVAASHIFVSTADHEFFGVAALEAALSGVVPVLPADLAYPETLPSAFFYLSGDLDQLTRITSALLVAPSLPTASTHNDASRYLARVTVPAFDDRVAEVVERRRR